MIVFKSSNSIIMTQMIIFCLICKEFSLSLSWDILDVFELDLTSPCSILEASSSKSWGRWARIAAIFGKICKKRAYLIIVSTFYRNVVGTSVYGFENGIF